VEQNASEIESLISKYPRKLKGEGALDPKKPEDERREGWKDNGFVLVEERVDGMLPPRDRMSR